MSLHHYVAGKDEILNGIVDLVFSEIGLSVTLDALSKSIPGGSSQPRLTTGRGAGDGRPAI